MSFFNPLYYERIGLRVFSNRNMNVVQMINSNSSPYSPFTCALFDLDGTLVDTAPDLAAALNHCLAADGHPPFAVDEMRSLVGHGAAALLKRGYLIREGADITSARLDELRRRFLSFYAEAVCVASEPFEGVEDVLDNLAQAGLKLGVCTNKPHDMALRLLAALGWSKRFDDIVGGDYFGFKKPDPRHVTSMLKRLNQEVSSSIFVGDSDADYHAAQSAGVATIIVRFGYSAHPMDYYQQAVLLGSYSEFDGAVAELARKAG